jgi:hypothetical protein
MSSVGGVCPACKRLLADHLPSAQRTPAQIADGRVAVINGRCQAADGRAPQKLCWVMLSEPMTPEEYRNRMAEGRLRLEKCPGCGGALVAHGTFCRTLVGPHGSVEEIRLLRGRCREEACPVCTVTHYPSFMTPYHPVPTAKREAVVRARAEGASWLAVTEQVALTTARRWCARVEARAVEVWIGLTAIRYRLDPRVPAPPGKLEASGPKAKMMFEACDAVRALVARTVGEPESLPSLAIPRLFQPPAPTTLPVWT